MATPTLDTGSTAWILICMALVQLMLPGLAFFYAGLLKQKSVVVMIMQNYAAMGVVTLIWFLFGFSLCFGETATFYGDITTFWGFKDVDGLPLGYTSTGTNIVGDIPGLLFAGYQGMFAVITPALMTGAFADRLLFGPYLIFIALWIILVYCPHCHAIWGPAGWLGVWGVKDFAGGIVVHTTAGFSALAAVHFLGARSEICSEEKVDNVPHNIPFVALGTALLWFGWFGFNGGSALGSGASATYAAVNTEIAASTAMVVWTGIEWYKNGKPSLVGMCVGAIAGLATITPAAGFIMPWAACVIGFTAGAFCFGCCELKNYFEWDDALDVWGVHGMGGALGSVLLGVFADEKVGGLAASGEVFGKQLATTVGSAIYSYALTIAILYGLGLVMRLKPTAAEMQDLDNAMHGEEAYSAGPGKPRELKAGSTLPALNLEVPVTVPVIKADEVKATFETPVAVGAVEGEGAAVEITVQNPDAQ